MAKKKKNSIKISKKALKLWFKIGIFLIIFALGAYFFNNWLNDYNSKRWEKIFEERNSYCNTTWFDYINNEVINQTTESIYVTKNCFYENEFVMNKLSSLCLCTFEVYDLNHTLINDNFTLLYSVFNDV